MSGSGSSTHDDVVDLGSTEKASLPTEFSSSIDEKALVRRMDWKILPMLFIVYVAAFLDRVNVSNALTMNLPTELGLVGNQANIALTVFFVPYVLFEIPSNILLKHFRPHIWLSLCILTFGVVMLAQGFVTNFGGLVATRFLLGLAEAGVFPGSYYLISFWYKREEAQKRFTIYWCSVLIASAFGGLLASAIANMNGVGGYSNWRWLFILEGIGTIIIGVIAFFFISDFPEQAKWLTEEERKFVISRTGRDKQVIEKVTPKDVLVFFTDIKNILGAILYFAIVVPIYSFSYFAPTIIKTLGYSTVQTQLHTVPPVAAALVLALIIAYLSDRTGLRSPFIAFGIAITAVGLAILIGVQDSFSAKYLGLHFIAMGALACGPIVVCWYVMNLQGHVNRSIGTAWLISFGNTGGIIATFSFLATDAPKYIKGYTICLVVTVVGGIAATGYGLLVWKENRELKKVAAEGDREVVYNSL